MAKKEADKIFAHLNNIQWRDYFKLGKIEELVLTAMPADKISHNGLIYPSEIRGNLDYIFTNQQIYTALKRLATKGFVEHFVDQHGRSYGYFRTNYIPFENLFWLRETSDIIKDLLSNYHNILLKALEEIHENKRAQILAFLLKY